MKKSLLSILVTTLLAASCPTFSFVIHQSNPSVAIVNATEKNLQVLASFDNGSQASMGTVMYTNEPSFDVVNLTSDGTEKTYTTLHIDEVFEIDNDGNAIDNSFSTKFDASSCVAKTGQTLLLEQAGNKQINCKVIGEPSVAKNKLLT